MPQLEVEKAELSSPIARLKGREEICRCVRYGIVYRISIGNLESMAEIKSRHCSVDGAAYWVCLVVSKVQLGGRRRLTMLMRMATAIFVKLSLTWDGEFDPETLLVEGMNSQNHYLSIT